MTDLLSPKQRSSLMARVAGRDTKPEWILRSALHRLGFRYRLGGAGLSGRPDLVMPKHRTAIFIHGCFWHVHPGCRHAGLPRTNTAFWKEKLGRNVRRDADNRHALERSGWKVITVWECDLYRNPVAVAERVARSMTAGVKSSIDYAGRIERLERSALLAIAEKKVRYRLGASALPDDPAGGESLLGRPAQFPGNKCVGRIKKRSEPCTDTCDADGAAALGPPSTTQG